MLTWQPNDSEPRNAVNRGRRSPRIDVKLSGVSFVIAMLCPLPQATATSLARLELSQIIARAAATVRARCLAVETRTDSQGIWTLTVFHRMEVWKGDVAPNFAVLLPGGAAGGRKETVECAPRFRLGEEVVLFLEPLRAGQWTIVGWVQGTYRIQLDPRSGIESALPDSAGMLLFDPRDTMLRSSESRAISVAQLRAMVMRRAQGEAR